MVRETKHSGFGIGAQVFVRNASPVDTAPWDDEPAGIIVRSSGSAISGVWGNAERSRMWWVDFDEPQSDHEGRTFHTAEIAERYLELAPPFEANDAAADRPA